MSNRPILELRSRIRSGLRELFDGQGFVEVDTPVLSTEVLPEVHIDPIAVHVDGVNRPPHYLQASPEALMKRLLAAGSGPIYQFARSFRAGERGSQHDIEFVLLEWYAPGTTLDDAASLLDSLCRGALGTSGIDRISCSRAFTELADVDPLSAPLEELAAAGRRAGLAPPSGVAREPAAQQWDRWFELLLAEVIMPRLGHERPTMLQSWPVSQAAFAQIDPDDPRASRRFELIVSGVELANGWEEEPSRSVLETRIVAANQIRLADGRALLPTPERLLAAHGPGMPEGVGVALGFDRLVMLAAGVRTIDEVRCFTSRS
ncbi:MAG: amino acid--tRNA ligase-related protein [Planctomycetota bacterium]